jgi:hypothetical protein
VGSRDNSQEHNTRNIKIVKSVFSDPIVSSRYTWVQLEYLSAFFEIFQMLFYMTVMPQVSSSSLVKQLGNTAAVKMNVSKLTDSP